jgi:UDP-2,3-diacylglucosamine hydrolase
MQKIYFASDFHLGVDAKYPSVERESQIIRWLDKISADAGEIILVGDIFDFWFEFKSVIPRGHIRLIGKLATLKEKGISISLFTGNHDMWMFGFFEEELGIPVYRKPQTMERLGKTFFIGHGDGLGPGDAGYKRLKRIFRSPVSQWLFARLHPNFSFPIARFWSKKSRLTQNPAEEFLGSENEWLIQYANRKLDQESIDYFIFGHRHLPIDYLLKNGKSRYINLGDWLYFNSYASFDGEDVQLSFYNNPDGKVYPER